MISILISNVCLQILFFSGLCSKEEWTPKKGKKNDDDDGEHDDDDGDDYISVLGTKEHGTLVEIASIYITYIIIDYLMYNTFI